MSVSQDHQARASACYGAVLCAVSELLISTGSWQHSTAALVTERAIRIYKDVLVLRQSLSYSGKARLKSLLKCPETEGDRNMSPIDI